jgi:hypothetical protein
MATMCDADAVLPANNETSPLGAWNNGDAMCIGKKVVRNTFVGCLHDLLENFLSLIDTGDFVLSAQCEGRS